MLSPKSLLDWTPAEARHGGFASGTQRVPEPERPLRSEEHTSELQSQSNLVCRLLLEKKIRARVRTPCTETGMSSSHICSSCDRGASDDQCRSRSPRGRPRASAWRRRMTLATERRSFL